MPDRTQPPEPARGLLRCQTSSKASGRRPSLADQAAEAHAGDASAQPPRPPRAPGRRADDLGLLRGTGALHEIHLELGEHLGRRDLAQLVEVAAVVGGLQADEVDLGAAHEGLDVEAGGHSGSGSGLGSQAGADGRTASQTGADAGCRQGGAGRQQRDVIGARGLCSRLGLVETMSEAPASAGRWAAARRRMIMPMTATATIASSAIIMKEAICSPKPKCRPARPGRCRRRCRPAGPSRSAWTVQPPRRGGHHRTGGRRGGMGRSGRRLRRVAPGALPTIISRCMPVDLPPPRRLAASASPTPKVRPRASTAASRDMVFILISCNGKSGSRATG